jgi:hypothetical protein
LFAPTRGPYLSGIGSHFELTRTITLDASDDELAEVVDLGAVLETVGAIKPLFRDAK